MATITQEKLVSNYLQLLSAKSTGIVYKDDYRAELSEVSDLPVAFPVLAPKTTVYSEKSAPTAPEKSIRLKFKSIKPPFKFNIEFDSNSSNTVYQIKGELLSHIAKQDSKFSGIQADQVKLLVKSKVPQDSVALVDLEGLKDDVVSFMVVVDGSKANPPATPVDAEPESDILAPQGKIEISDILWQRIGQVLAGELGEPSASAAIEKLKKGWLLAK